MLNLVLPFVVIACEYARDPIPSVVHEFLCRAGLYMTAFC